MFKWIDKILGENLRVVKTPIIQKSPKWIVWWLIVLVIVLALVAGLQTVKIEKIEEAMNETEKKV